MSTPTFRLDSRVALITGSSQGIGLGIAEGLAAAGARVVINGRDASKVGKAVAAIKAHGHDAHAAAFDVTVPVEVEKAVAGIESQVGPIAILVNNAGIQRRGPLEDFSDDAWSEVIRTNLDSLYYMSKHVGRRMIPRKSGSIINICSVMSELGRPTVVPYTAAKGGVRMLTRGLATEWGKYNIRVNGIAPGYFKTELNKALIEDQKFSSWVAGRTPLGRWGDVVELQGAAVFLGSDASSFVTGTILYVDGGMTASV